MRNGIAARTVRCPSKESGNRKAPFSDLGRRFIAYQVSKGNSKNTVKHYKQSIRKLEEFLAYQTMSAKEYRAASKEERRRCGGETFVSVLNSDGIDVDFRFFLIDEEGISTQTVSTYFRDYRAIAYFAMDSGMIERRNITVPHVETDVREVYTDDELDRLLREPRENCSFAEYRDWVVVNYLLATGNRVGTIVNLKIADIDFQDNMISINVQKNRKKTRIPLEETRLMPILKKYIERWLKDENDRYLSEYLFPSSYADSDYPMSRVSMGRSIAHYNQRRGVNKTSIHLFRHTFAKNWIMNGGDLHSLQKMLGHSTLDMVTHYANLYDTDLQAKVKAYSALAVHKRRTRGHTIKRAVSRKQRG